MMNFDPQKDTDMNLIELLRSRRSVRRFTDEPLADATMSLIREALLRSPTSKNNRPWDFVLVDDRPVLEQLATVKEHGSAFLKDAAIGVVFLADEQKSDVWVEDCAIAAITLQYLCESLELGSCWIQIRLRNQASGDSAERRVQALLQVPDTRRVASIVAIGHPVKKGRPVPFASLPSDRIHMNRYRSGTANSTTPMDGDPHS